MMFLTLHLRHGYYFFLCIYLLINSFIHRYGYRDLAVEVEFDFGGGESAWVTIGMAPIDEMPHTIYTFLEQVSMGLYDDGGYAFHHNGNHIIMGSPEVNHLTPLKMDPMQRFTDSGVANVLFQEYSVDFPHEPYTVGFAGRPGGPSFYFNMEDNSGLHGPNGYAADGSADPCFGRVTRGQDVIDQIHGLTGEMEHADWKQIDSPVAVRSIKILN
jgi:cyclophilin family peptidyl-prolyl cis-trans isomerase